MKHAGLGISLALTFLVGTAHASSLVYFNDFSSDGLDGAGGLESVQGYEGVNGISGSFFRNDTVGGASTVTLNGLGNHNALEIDFAIALIDSWDGGQFGTCCGGSIIGPDFFNLAVDGANVLQTSNFDPLAPEVQDFAGGTFGFNPEFDDNAGTVSLTIPHTVGTATLSFFADGAGYQGGDDESWAIDNLSVSTSGSHGGGPEVIPLPASLPLMLGALGLVALGARRRH